MADEMAVTITAEQGVSVDGKAIGEGATVTMRGAVARSLIRRKLAKKAGKAEASEALPVAEAAAEAAAAPAAKASAKKGR